MSPLAQRLMAIRGASNEAMASRRAIIAPLDPAAYAVLVRELEALEAEACTIASMATDLQSRCRDALSCIPMASIYDGQVQALCDGGVRGMIDSINAEIDASIEAIDSLSMDAPF